LSKFHSKFQKIEDESEKLPELVPYEMLNYKDAILKKQMKELENQIKMAQDDNDIAQVNELVMKLSNLWQDSKKIISKHLGERIVIKI
jgi:DNA primase